MRGFTLIETLFSISLFVIVVLGVYEAYQALYLSMAVSEQKLSALEAASTAFEKARSLSYAELGTVGGDPLGVLEPKETIIKNGAAYDMKTAILNGSDYKIMEVTVACDGCRNFSPVSLTGRFAPQE